MKTLDPSINDQETSLRLIETAGRIFAEKGYRHATVREICGKARANVASIHYHFGGKDGLYAEVLAYGARQGVNVFPSDRGLGPSPTPEERLRAYIHSFLCRFLDEELNSGWYNKLCAAEMVAPTIALEKVVKEIIRPMFEELCGILKLLSPRASTASIDLQAKSIVGQCIFYHHARPVLEQLGAPKHYSAADIRRLADHITDFSLKGVK